MFLYDNCLYNNPTIIHTELDGVYFELEVMKYLIDNNICKEDTIIAMLILHKYMNDAAQYLMYHLKNLLQFLLQ